MLRKVMKMCASLLNGPKNNMLGAEPDPCYDYSYSVISAH